MLDECVVIARTLAIEFFVLVSGQWKYNVRSECRQEGDEWFEIRVDVLHDKRVPRQVRLDGNHFENTGLEGVEKLVIALCEVFLGFLLEWSVVESAYPNKNIEKRF
jgi:hypothetical protein